MDFATSKMNKLQNLTFSSPASKASREEPNFIKKTCELCFRFVTPPVCLLQTLTSIIAILRNMHSNTPFKNFQSWLPELFLSVCFKHLFLKNSRIGKNKLFDIEKFPRYAPFAGERV